MDDKRLDDIIKQKVEGFVDNGHDAHALTDLRNRLSVLSKNKSRWNWGKTGYIVSSILFFTLINAGISWYFSEGRHMELNKEIDQLKIERSHFLNIQDDLMVPKLNNVDTVYIYRNLITPGNAGSSSTLTPATASVPYSIGSYHQNDLGISNGTNQHYQLFNGESLSEELKAFLRNNNMVLADENGQMVLIAQSPPVNAISKSEYSLYGDNRYPATAIPQYLSGVATYQQPEPYRKPEIKRMPTKMLWALEKHNHSGIDFQFGVEGIYHQSNFDVGDGERNGGFGLMAELLFSPEWRLETGVHFGARAYKIGEQEINDLPPSFFEDYPGYDDQLGALTTLESDAILIKVPLNLKRFAPLDHNKRWYVSAGLTPQWSRVQEFEYKYSLQVPNPPQGGEFVSFVGSKQEAGASYYTTTLNLGLGTEVYLNEQIRWQLGIFYQKGLGDAGHENRQLTSSYGLKSSFWFNPLSK
jgi:hypothetical protein